MKHLILKVNFITSQFGIDLIKFVRGIVALPMYMLNFSRFMRNYKGKIVVKPCLHDRFSSAGEINTEYFWQDLIVAQAINKARPDAHLDIGSRVDGFVANVASFMTIDVLDIRPVKKIIPNINFIQGDLLSNQNVLRIKNESYPSISSLHVFEHFGLGRYGDPLMIDAYKNAFMAISSILMEGGVFYLSTPVGRERVEFDSNYVYDPLKILECADLNNLSLTGFTQISVGGGRCVQNDVNNIDWQKLRAQDYTLGLFVFTKRIS